jgi:hypothetical protein
MHCMLENPNPDYIYAMGVSRPLYYSCKYMHEHNIVKHNTRAVLEWAGRWIANCVCVAC